MSDYDCDVVHIEQLWCRNPAKNTIYFKSKYNLEKVVVIFTKILIVKMKKSRLIGWVRSSGSHHRSATAVIRIVSFVCQICVQSEMSFTLNLFKTCANSKFEVYESQSWNNWKYSSMKITLYQLVKLSTFVENHVMK